MVTKHSFSSLMVFGLVLVSLTFASFSIAEVIYLGTDLETQGDWIGEYGRDGAIIFCNEDANFHVVNVLPEPYEPSEEEKLFKKGVIEEIEITASGGQDAYGWIFNAEPPDTDKIAPWRVDGSNRYAACVSGHGGDVSITLTVNSTHYIVTVYFMDYDTPDRQHDIYGYQGDDLPAEADELIEDYTQGVHASWEVTEDEPFRYFAKNIAGSVNSVATAVFVEDIGAAVESTGKLSTTWGHVKNEY